MSSQVSSAPSREKFLERKIQMLDKRLTQVEKFIELRFHGRQRAAYSDNENEDYFQEQTTSKKGESSTRKTRQKPQLDTCSEEEEEVEKESPPNRSSGKKQKAGPTAVKRKREDVNVSKASKQFKECVIRVETSKETPTPPTTTSSGRVRRTPKRLHEEISESPKTRESSRIKRRGEDKSTGEEEEGDVVKTEVLETSGAAEIDIAGDDDFFGGDGPPSPADMEDEGSGKESEEEPGYFTFPKSQSPPAGRRKTGKRGRPKKAVHSSENDEDDNDDDWMGGGEDDEGDNDEDDDEDYETPERKTPIRSSRSSVKGEQMERSQGYQRRTKRTYTKVDLKELPTDSVVSCDPNMKLCTLCNWHFKVDVYEAHLETHARERHLRCPECGKAYYNQFTLKKHMKSHDPEKYTKKCRQCEKPFLHSDKLLAHERYCVKKALENNEHVDQELLEDLKTRTKNTTWIYEAMEVGSRNAEIDPEEKKLCPHCKKNFKLRIYDRHVLSHTKPKNWSCNMCDKSYHYKHDLVRHVAVEHVLTPTCEFCQKEFESRDELKEHMVECRRKHRKGLKIKSVKSLGKSTPRGSSEQVKVKQERDSQQTSVEIDCVDINENEEDAETGEQVEPIPLFEDATAEMETEEVLPRLALAGENDEPNVNDVETEVTLYNSS